MQKGYVRLISSKRNSDGAETLLKPFLFLACACFVITCYGEEFKNKKQYLDEINNFQLERPTRRSFGASEELLAKISKDLTPIAVELCQEIGKRLDCEAGWSLELSKNRTFNAYAAGRRDIVFFTGLVNQTTHADEIALVLAHEMGHHALNHVRSSKIRATTGALIGGALGALSGIPEIAAQGAQVGAQVGVLSYSAEQERAADRYAYQVISSSGYDVVKARFLLLRMAKISPSITTPFLASHPSGPERLFNYDQIRETMSFEE